MPRRRPPRDGPPKLNARYCCIQCHQWKIPDEFAPSMLRIIRADPGIDPAHCAMKCRTCSEKPELYLCEGDCGEEKPASAFSKNSRRTQVWKCLACTSMTGLQEAFQPVVEKENLARMLPYVDTLSTATPLLLPGSDQSAGCSSWAAAASTARSTISGSSASTSEAAFSSASTSDIRPKSAAAKMFERANTSQRSGFGRPMAGLVSASSRGVDARGWPSTVPPVGSQASMPSAPGSEQSNKVRKPELTWIGKTAENLRKDGKAPWE